MVIQILQQPGQRHFPEPLNHQITTGTGRRLQPAGCRSPRPQHWFWLPAGGARGSCPVPALEAAGSQGSSGNSKSQPPRLQGTQGARPRPLSQLHRRPPSPSARSAPRASFQGSRAHLPRALLQQISSASWGTGPRQYSALVPRRLQKPPPKIKPGPRQEGACHKGTHQKVEITRVADRGG